MKKAQHREGKMKALYADWQLSGLSKKAYCQKVGMPHATFFYWAKKFRAGEGSSAEAFLEVDLSSHFPVSELPFLEIEYPSGAKLKLYRQAEASWIKSLL